MKIVRCQPIVTKAFQSSLENRTRRPWYYGNWKSRSSTLSNLEQFDHFSHERLPRTWHCACNCSNTISKCQWCHDHHWHCCHHCWNECTVASRGHKSANEWNSPCLCMMLVVVFDLFCFCFCFFVWWWFVEKGGVKGGSWEFGVWKFEGNPAFENWSGGFFAGVSTVKRSGVSAYLTTLRMVYDQLNHRTFQMRAGPTMVSHNLTIVSALPYCQWPQTQSHSLKSHIESGLWHKFQIITLPVSRLTQMGSIQLFFLTDLLGGVWEFYSQGVDRYLSLYEKLHNNRKYFIKIYSK